MFIGNLKKRKYNSTLKIAHKTAPQRHSHHDHSMCTDQNLNRNSAHAEILILYAKGLLLQRQHQLYEGKNEAVERMIARGVAVLRDCVHSPEELVDANRRRVEELIREIDNFTALQGEE